MPRGGAIAGILPDDGTARDRVGSVRGETCAKGCDDGGRRLDPFRLERGLEIGDDRARNAASSSARATSAAISARACGSSCAARTHPSGGGGRSRSNAAIRSSS